MKCDMMQPKVNFLKSRALGDIEMSQDNESFRWSTKRPMASKSIHLDQENSNCNGCSFSNLSSQAISPENYNLFSLKEEINKCDNGKIPKDHALNHLQLHLALLERHRMNFLSLMKQAENEHLSSRQKDASKTKIIDYNPPLKIRFGLRPSIDLSSNRSGSSLHGSTSTANLLTITRSNNPILSPSASSASIAFSSIQRPPSSPSTIRDKTRSNIQEFSSTSASLIDSINGKGNSTLVNSSNSESKIDDDILLLGTPDPLSRNQSEPLKAMNTVSFSTNPSGSSASSSLPRSMSTSHFSRGSNSSSDEKGEKDSSSNSSKNASSSTKSMTSLTIWNNVNKFFVVTPTVEQFQQKLQLTEPPDIKLPLGPHYSIGVNQKLKQKFKSGNVQLRIPPEVIAESPEGVTSIIFHRLLAAFVSLTTDDITYIRNKKKQQDEEQNEIERPDDQITFKNLNPKSSSDISTDFENEGEAEKQVKTVNFSTDNISGPPGANLFTFPNSDMNMRNGDFNAFSDYSNIEQYPVNIAGTSIYSMCPFEQKLMLEVQSLNLIPDSSGLKMTDNEVMNDIVQKTKELKQIAEETNMMKTELLDTLKKKEKDLLDRKEKAKKWGSVSFKVEQGQKKDLKRPKKRDKLI